MLYCYTPQSTPTCKSYYVYISRAFHWWNMAQLWKKKNHSCVSITGYCNRREHSTCSASGYGPRSPLHTLPQANFISYSDTYLTYFSFFSFGFFLSIFSLSIRYENCNKVKVIKLLYNAISRLHYFLKIVLEFTALFLRTLNN